jgi:hypothetical protein
MTEEKTIIEKVRKLLAKANGTTNSHEAAAFLGKAQALQLQHKIDTMDLEYVEELCQMQSEPLNQQDRGRCNVPTWKGNLANVLATANGCYVYEDSGKIMLTGKPSDCDAVRYLYAYCVIQINGLVDSLGSGLGRTYYNNFRLGCVEAIELAIERETELMRQHYHSNERALMTLNQIVVCYNAAKRLVTSKISITKKSNRSSIDEDALGQGRAAGSRIYNKSNVTIGNQRLLS